MSKGHGSLKPDATFEQDLTSGPLSFTTSYSRKFKLESVIGRASVAITETISIYLDSINGANYDALLGTCELVSEQDFVFRPQGEANFQDGDEIRVECTNANVTGVIRGMVKASEILK